MTRILDNLSPDSTLKSLLQDTGCCLVMRPASPAADRAVRRHVRLGFGLESGVLQTGGEVSGFGRGEV